MSAAEWGAQARRQLTDSGVAPPEAHRLVDEHLAEAESEGLEPTELYGPATSYAMTLAQTLRSAHATSAPLERKRGAVVLRLESVSKRYRRRRAHSTRGLRPAGRRHRTAADRGRALPPVRGCLGHGAGAGAGVLVVTHLLRDLDAVDRVLELNPAEVA